MTATNPSTPPGETAPSAPSGSPAAKPFARSVLDRLRFWQWALPLMVVGGVILLYAAWLAMQMNADPELVPEKRELVFRLLYFGFGFYLAGRSIQMVRQVRERMAKRRNKLRGTSA